MWDLTGDNTDTLTNYAETTEYGLPLDTGTASTRYGWLGTYQRDTVSALGSMTLMGVRLYNPATGRFLSRDSVVGGNDNAYVYPADPIGESDLSGKFKGSNKYFRWSVTVHWKKVKVCRLGLCTTQKVPYAISGHFSTRRPFVDAVAEGLGPWSAIQTTTWSTITGSSRIPKKLEALAKLIGSKIFTILTVIAWAEYYSYQKLNRCPSARFDSRMPKPIWRTWPKCK